MSAHAEKVLRQKSLRITPIRRLMLGLMMNQHGPHNAAELFEMLKGQLDVDLATIYRSLKTFEDAKVVKRCELGDGSIRYEFADQASGLSRLT